MTGQQQQADRVSAEATDLGGGGGSFLSFGGGTNPSILASVVPVHNVISNMFIAFILM